MKLSTGKVGFPIEFDNGDKDVIYFNPNDRGIQDRIKSFEASIQKREKEFNLQNDQIEYAEELPSFNGNIDKLFDLTTEEMQALQKNVELYNSREKKYNDIVKEELDNVFGSKISDIVFKYCQPFDMVIVEDNSGNETREMYVMQFMKWLAVELEKYHAKNKSAMDKHLSKYSK